MRRDVSSFDDATSNTAQHH